MTAASTSPLEIGLLGNDALTPVVLEGVEAQRVRDVLRSHASWGPVEQPWNPMSRYAGVEILRAFPSEGHLVAWSGKLVDREHHRAWDAPGLEEDLLGILVDKDQGESVRSALGWRRWRRLQRYRKR